MTDEFLDLSLVALRQQLADGAVSAREVIDATLRRIASREPQLAAFVRVLEDAARAQADALDRQRSADPKACGPLHGIPIALKDLLATAGIATTCGTRVRRDWLPDQDATVVTALRNAGAVFVGKVKLTEGAFGEHHPDVLAPRNPWNPDYWTGVSSSGSGVAVAGGLCHGAIGTDTGGSIRFPAAACGVVGIKPTYGRVSRAGAFPLADSLDHVGPIARTVADAAVMLGVLAGHDGRDATSLRTPVPNFPQAAQPNCQGLRLGYDADHCEAGVEPPVVAAVRSVLECMADAGATIVEVKLPDCRQLVDGWAITCGVECALAHAEHFPAHRSAYGPALAGLLDLGLRASAQDYAALERLREQFRAEVETLMEDRGLNALVLPAMPVATPKVAGMEEAERQMKRPFIAFTAPWDYSGHPTVTLPAATDPAGLPIGIQFAARLGDEVNAIRAATAWESLRGEFPSPPPA